MNPIRLSFSVLLPWSQGNYDEATRRFLRQEIQPTPQMEFGKLLHEQWRTHIDKYKELPPELCGDKLNDPQTEMKLEVMLEPWLQFVGIIDCLDGETIYEWKTGGADSNTYMRTPQPLVYQVLAHHQGFTPTKAVVRHYNQYTSKTTTSYRYLSQKSYDEGLNWIITTASEMKDSLDKSGIHYWFKSLLM